MCIIDSVPVELRDPFYLDQYEQEHLKPPVTRLLQSPELYCRTYGRLQAGGPGANGTPKDNTVLLQTLSQKGLSTRDHNTPVTEADLQHKPIKMVSGCGLYIHITCVQREENVCNECSSVGVCLEMFQADTDSVTKSMDMQGDVRLFRSF